MPRATASGKKPRAYAHEGLPASLSSWLKRFSANKFSVKGYDAGRAPDTATAARTPSHECRAELTARQYDARPVWMTVTAADNTPSR